MIKLNVDEGYAFDYLSILQVKNNLYPSQDKKEAFDNCREFLFNQLENFNEIFSSEEYFNLLKINETTFHLVDKVRNNELIPAKDVDDANMERYYCKLALQKKYFSSALTEQKILK